ncbi:LacI family DNA-binding transcriptional regulator [Flavimaricola marinus]|uniref:Ribose operon repressor n=1 Tax=Flavimaricola marinus TaxID=1819565 RepID=A0A238LL10_9RHOB|nr:LacI family DNA-binding transcriptional regulator [Flavimaricola marinus]SMY09550.1 Ribose operon repressor [Flavimaricola marinus]
MAGTAVLARPKIAPNKPVTLKDVAEKAGVSTAAVSRSFTPGAPVSEDMRKLVLATADALGYRPNRLAAGLASGRTGLVGLVTDDFANPALLELLGHFTTHLQEQGFRPILMNLGGDVSADKAIRMVQEYGVEALVLLSPTLPLPFIRAFDQSGLTVVQAFDFKSHQPFVSQSAVQDAAAGRLAANTLHERGYRKLAYLGGPRGDKSVRDPFPGYRITGEKLGITVEPFDASSWSYEGGFDAIQGLLKSSQCDACFCASDVLAIGALAALRQAGVSVPDDFGLIGLDDIAMSGWHDIGLTTIRIPRDEIAGHCIDLMQELRSEPDRARESRLIKPELIERTTLRAG